MIVVQRAAWPVVLAFAAVLAAHYAYYFFPVGTDDRRWAKYVGDGAGFCMMCVCVALLARQLVAEVGAAITMAGIWGALEGAQQWGCGAAHWGRGSDLDLCVSLYGTLPYKLAAAACAAWILTRRTKAPPHG